MIKTSDKLMKTITPYFFLILLASQAGCKTRYASFIKTQREHEVILKSTAGPYINFVLQTDDTIKFSLGDVVGIMDEWLSKDLKRDGYVSNKQLAKLRENLHTLQADTTVFQNLSAVGSTTIPDYLDRWIARELLLEGKGMIALKSNANPIQKLRYIYMKDILGGEQGSFYTTDKRLVYQSVISLGE